MAVGRYDNQSMKELLEETKKLGMTREHLNLWHPREDEEAKYPKTPHLRFESGHKKAVIALMKEKKLSALAAILEVSRLSAEEAVALVELYDLGVNGQYIRDHRHEHRFNASGFGNMLHVMTTVHKLSFDQALSEMKALCHNEWNMLATYYGSGLRGETLRSLRGETSMEDFSSTYSRKPEKVEDLSRLYRFLASGYQKERRDYLAAVIQADLKQGENWEDIITNAAHEARLIKDNSGVGCDVRKKLVFDTYHMHFEFANKSQRMHFLNRHLHQGVRAQDVPEVFSKHHLAMYRVLRDQYHRTVQQALKEMAGLNEEQVQLLKAYYKAGVRCGALAAYPYPAKQTQELLKHFQLLPADGLIYLHELNAMQFACLTLFANDGLTIAEAKQLQGEFNQLKQDIVMELIERGMQPYTALERVLPQSDEQAAKLLQEPIADFDRAAMVRL